MPRTGSTQLLITLLLANVLAACGADRTHAETGTPPRTFEFRPGIIVDFGHEGRIFMASARKGIEAIEIATGQQAWYSPVAQQPLTLHDSVLIAQADVPEQPNTLRLIGLDTTRPDKTEFSVDIKLPINVRVSVLDSLESSFRTNASMSGDLLILRWHHIRRTMTGMDNDNELGTADKRQQGVVELNLDNMQVQHRPADQLSVHENGDIPAVIRRRLEEAGLKSPLLRGERVFAVVRREGGSKGVTLHRWYANGENFPKMTLFRDGPTYRYASADGGRHLLASESAQDVADGHIGYLWSIYSVDTGERVATILRQSVGARFFVWDGLLIHDVPPTSELVNDTQVHHPPGLRAVAIGTGDSAWFVPVRDLRFLGELPPADNPASRP